MIPTQFEGGSVIFLPKCHSTNDVMSEMSEKGLLKEGDIVITDEQFAGKGQRGNFWESSPGQNLTFSIFLKPTFLDVADNFCLTIIISLGITEYLNSLGSYRFKIKWPNDIYYNDEKLAGLLIKNKLRAAGIESTVAGIGINVNQAQFSGDFNASSLRLIFKKEFSLNEVFNGILGKINKWYDQLNEMNFEKLKIEYLKNLYRLNESHEFNSNGHRFKGVIVDIDEKGRLVVKVDEKRKTFTNKEISFIN